MCQLPGYWPELIAQAFALRHCGRGQRCRRIRSAFRSPAPIWRFARSRRAFVDNGNAAPFGRSAKRIVRCLRAAVSVKALKSVDLPTSVYDDAAAEAHNFPVGEGVAASGEVERNAQPLAAPGAGKYFVPKPALPQQQQARARFECDERLEFFRRIVPPRWRRHHQLQARVLEPDCARSLWHLDIKSPGNDTVRVDVPL